MPQEFKPRVGHMVYYKSYGSPITADGTQKYPSVSRAAIVTDVTENTVSLCVLNPEGLFFKENCTQGQEGGQWDYMPI